MADTHSDCTLYSSSQALVIYGERERERWEVVHGMVLALGRDL